MMRKFLTLTIVTLITLLAVSVASAQDRPASTSDEGVIAERLVDASSQMPLGVARYIAMNGYTNDCKIIRFNDNKGWGNSVWLDAAAGQYVVGGNSINGNCRVPVSVVGTQDLINELCGFRRNGTLPRVNTSGNNWGNGARVLADGHRRGDLKISGQGVGGHCWLSGGEAALAYTIIPKFVRSGVSYADAKAAANGS